MSLGFGQPWIDALSVIGVIARENAKFILFLVLVQANCANVVRVTLDKLLQRNLLQLSQRKPVTASTPSIQGPLEKIVHVVIGTCYDILF